MDAQTARSWMESDDPGLHHAAFHTLLEHPEQVADMPTGERIALVNRFLEGALQGRYSTHLADGPFVFGHTAAGWLRTLARSQDPAERKGAADVVRMLERVAGSGGDQAREVLLLGVLEHVLNDPALRDLLGSWREDPSLAPLFEEGLKLAGADD